MEEERKNSKVQLDFLVPIKSTSTTERRKKEKINPKESAEQVKK